MACSLGCCGGFCLFVSIICAIMQFVFYGLLNADNQRIDIGDSSDDRNDYKNTPLITGIIYCLFVVISVFCIMARKKAVDFDANGGTDERSSLVDNSDAYTFDQRIGPIND